MDHRLAEVMEAQGRQGLWLARKTGKSPAYITRVLKGERRPSDDFKAAAAEALGVPVAMLFPAPPVDAAEAVA